MPTDQDIRNYLEQLQLHRRNAQIYRRQALFYGGEALAPPATQHGLSEAYAGIARCKVVLCQWEIEVTDLPDDFPQVDIDVTTTFERPQQKTNSNTDTINTHHRTKLLLLLQKRYKDRLSQNFTHQLRFQLSLSTRPDAVNPSWRRLHLRGPLISQPVSPEKPLIELFDEYHGQMLILGEPGAGKTTLLIELALSLVERAQNDNNSRIPVVLNISGWNNERSLREWLVLALRDLLGGTKDFAAQLAGGNNLLLLLDGLDEVTVKHRVACVQAINAYLSEYAIVPEIIVSCRSHEYSNIDAQLQIAGAIQLEPLDLPIVESILAEIPAAQGVLTALQTDALLRELATNPLMIQVLLLAHNSQNVPFAGANSVDERRKVLWSAYVKRMLQQRPLQQWNTTQTLRWLRWLAQILFEPKSRIRFFVDDPYHHFENDLLFDTLRFNQNKFEFNNFLIDHIQPTLLPSEQYYNRYSLLTNVTTSIISISSILIVSLIIFSITPVQNVILLVAFLILSLAICLRGDRDRIHLPIERRIYKKWSWRRSLAAIDPFNQRILPKDDDYIQFLIKMNKEIPGYTPKPILEFVSELISGFNRGWYIETIKSGNSPMQSFHIEMWHNFRKIPLDAFLKSIFVMLFLVLSITLAYVTDGGNISISSIGYLLIPALFYGIPQTFMIPRNLLQHYILRYLLFDAGSIPFRTVTFLEAMNERLLLGRNEASYYFRHALLREFFADLTDDQINELANQI